MEDVIRLGIDVGGTNTDAVLMRGRDLIASHKTFTTTDVGTGVVSCVTELLAGGAVPASSIKAVMIGTTQFVNAFVQRKNLDRVCVIRVAAPKSDGIPPLAGWPTELRSGFCDWAIVRGGAYFDGREYAELDEAEIMRVAARASADGIRNFVVSATFSPVKPALEARAAACIEKAVAGAHVTRSVDVGGLGLVERENAAIINASLTNLADSVVTSLVDAFHRLGIDAPVLFSQNDGTLISSEIAQRFPIFTCSAGPTNSLRGAAFLTGIDDAIIADIGGTTTDIGFLSNGFPRESTGVHMMGGVRTNLRMPDLLSIPLGGGTIVRQDARGLRLGPDSVGHRLASEALVFGGSTLTTTDAAVAGGACDIGNASLVANLVPEAASIIDLIHRTVEDSIDQMRTSSRLVPLILVGGGSVLVSRDIGGVSATVRPKHAEVANAIGAAIAMVSGRVNKIYDFKKNGREGALELARGEAIDAAVASGARRETVEVVELIEMPMPYIDTGSVQVKARAVGDLVIA